MAKAYRMWCYGVGFYISGCKIFGNTCPIDGVENKLSPNDKIYFQSIVTDVQKILQIDEKDCNFHVTDCRSFFSRGGKNHPLGRHVYSPRYLLPDVKEKINLDLIIAQDLEPRMNNHLRYRLPQNISEEEWKFLLIREYNRVIHNDWLFISILPILTQIVFSEILLVALGHKIMCFFIAPYLTAGTINLMVNNFEKRADLNACKSMPNGYEIGLGLIKRFWREYGIIKLEHSHSGFLPRIFPYTNEMRIKYLESKRNLFSS